jgi:hypothetical protein
MSAEADKKIGVIYSWRQLWMGHTEGIEAVYTTNKTIPEDVVEQMRKAYAEASEAYLTLPKTRMTSIQEASNEFKRIYLAEYGRMSDQEIDKLGDLANYSFQQLTSIVEKRKPTTPREQGSKLPQEQIMVPVRKVDEINKYLKKGYEIKIELSNKQVVLYIPERASH